MQNRKETKKKTDVTEGFISTIVLAFTICDTYKSQYEPRASPGLINGLQICQSAQNANMQCTTAVTTIKTGKMCVSIRPIKIVG